MAMLHRVTSRSLLDNRCPTKHNTQGGVAAGDAIAGLNPGSLRRDTWTVHTYPRP